MTSELRTVKPRSRDPVSLLTPCRALRIISERSTKGDTRDLLLEQLASKHKISQGRALNALNFLVSNRARMSSSLSIFF